MCFNSAESREGKDDDEIEDNHSIYRLLHTVKTKTMCNVCQYKLHFVRRQHSGRLFWGVGRRKSIAVMSDHGVRGLHMNSALLLPEPLLFFFHLKLSVCR